MFELRRPLVGALLALCAGTALASRSIAPPSFDDETAQTHQTDQHLSMAMWFTTESLRNISAGLDLDPVAKKAFVASLKGYAIFGVVDVTLDGDKATVISADHAALRASARLRLGDRAPRAIVREEDLPDGVRIVAQTMRPLMAGMLGKFGDSMEFIVFSDADEHGESLADPRGGGGVTVSFDKEVFAWQLPLISLRPLRIDRATGDTFPGDYDFSPFTGHKLETK